MAAHSVRVRSAVAAAAVTLVAAGSALVAAVPAAASSEPYCTTTWTGGSGAWSDASRWSTGTVPGPTDYVCVLRTAGAPAPAVTLRATTTLEQVTLQGATLRLPGPGTTLTVDELVAERATVAGPGRVVGTQWGAVRLHDVGLAGGVLVDTGGSLFLTDTVTLTGGSRVEQTPLAHAVQLVGDALVVRDGDAHPGNHLRLTAGMYVDEGQDVAFEVPTRLADAEIEIAGTLRLPALEGLDAAGVLRSPDDRYLSLTTYDDGRVVLARPVTEIGHAVVVVGSARLVTPGGTDALADLARVSGTLRLWRPLVLAHSLDVTGRLDASAEVRVAGMTIRDSGSVSVYAATLTALRTPLVQVGPDATLSVRSVSGRVQSAGGLTALGTTVGSLVLTGTAQTRTSVEYPLAVRGRALVAGVLQVDLPPVRRLPADGDRTPLVTAPGGLTGQFGAVVARPASRGSYTLEYTPTQVIGVFHAAG